MSESPEGRDLTQALLEALERIVAARVAELERDDEPVPLADAASEFPLAGVCGLLGIPDLSLREAVAVLLAAAPELQPHVLDEAIASALRTAGDHPRLGGMRGRDSRVFLPTAETLIFLLGARTVQERLDAMQLLDPHHRLLRRRLIGFDAPAPGEPASAGRITAGGDALERLIAGGPRRPRTGPEFPAELIDTDLDWDDLVLEPTTLESIHELEAWVRHGATMLDEWGLRKRIRPGYRALFFGPPGTGKTLTASLLGRYTGRDVYRIDLSLVVSKFIGETEKNLAKIFSQAEDRAWILFFDEADALFGKRTQVRDAHDRYANQEVAYLLQRVECFEGLVILASNFRSNIDDAFLRRFQSVIHFPKPTPEQRFLIWRKMLPTCVHLEDKVNLRLLCQRHELTGANVANIVQYTCLQALRRGDETLRIADIHTAIEREYQKEGRVA